VVVGVHTPEFPFEKDLDNVRRAVQEMRVGYPVAIDNDYAVWSAFDNHYWPALYFASPGGAVLGKRHAYTTPAELRRNHWALSGDWTMEEQATTLNTAGGQIAHCRKHLPRLVRQPVARHWGTDSPLHKGGDYFGVAASRAADVSETAI
jgi:hypothetical protein